LGFIQPKVSFVNFLFEILLRKVESPFLEYMKKYPTKTTKSNKYNNLIKSFGYPHEINDILKGEILDSKERGSYVKNWSD